MSNTTVKDKVCDVKRVVIACDKFKGSLTAPQVAEAISVGLRNGDPSVETASVIVADGGDGTIAAVIAAGFSEHPVTVTGPTGEPVHTAVALSPDATTAVVEMADSCGLMRLPNRELAPLAASSRGLGEAILAALDLSPETIVIGIGGSASTDGGSGMISALGGRLLDANGEPVNDGAGGVGQIVQVDLSDLDPRLKTTSMVLACDVSNPLIGPNGAAAVYGPQKGLSPDDVERCDTALTAYADLIDKETGTALREHPGAGAAGGVGYAALSVLGVKLKRGVDLVLDLVGFDTVVDGADLVVTGEGSLDAQSLTGKTPIGVLEWSAKHDVPVIAVCGRTTLSPEEAADAGFVAVHALTQIEPNPERSMANAYDLLVTVAETVVQAER